jgi:hypothetical protein
MLRCLAAAVAAAAFVGALALTPISDIPDSLEQDVAAMRQELDSIREMAWELRHNGRRDRRLQSTPTAPTLSIQVASRFSFFSM